MFSHVHEMGIIPSGSPISPFIVCYMCSYPDEVGEYVALWVMDDVLCLTSPQLHAQAVQHSFSALTHGTHRPPIPSSRCDWMVLQQRAVNLLSSLEPYVDDDRSSKH
jgi:hypothetical protein